MVGQQQIETAKGPLERLIGLSARNWLLTLMLVGAAAGWGWRSLAEAPLDAIPDLSDVQVIVFTNWPARTHRTYARGRPIPV